MYEEYLKKEDKLTIDNPTGNVDSLKNNIWKSKQTIAALIITILICVISSYFIVSQLTQRSPQDELLAQHAEATVNNITSTPTIVPGTQSISSLDPNSAIKVAFIRKSVVYLYEDGKEKIVAKPTKITTAKECFNLSYPFVSPDSKYLAYIEEVGDAPSKIGCEGGKLNVVEIQTGKIYKTIYKVQKYDWNERSQIELNSYDSKNGTMEYIVYDPVLQKEMIKEVVQKSIQDSYYKGFPIFDETKIVRFKDNAFYLADKYTKEKLLIADKDIKSFRGWSPDGIYAIFSTSLQKEVSGQLPGNIWYAINVNDSRVSTKKTIVYSGTADDEASRGNKWYFNEGFVSYCSQYLSYLDGREPFELTHSGGGGCQNAEGFVSTSPNGEYAFIKYSNRFEIHQKDGKKFVVSESINIPKGKGVPKNFLWINNDYLVIFESAYNNTDKNPRVFLFDRKANKIYPLIENAYLNSVIN